MAGRETMIAWLNDAYAMENSLIHTLEQRIKANVHKLVNFTSAVEKNCGISGRVLWSESEDNLAQKLIERLQKVQ